MSTLKNIQSSPFIQHGNPSITDYQLMKQMPRSLAASTSPSPSELDSSKSKKRKYVDNLFTTPTRLSKTNSNYTDNNTGSENSSSDDDNHHHHNVLITPPNSNKRVKRFSSTLPSNNFQISGIYETPKTPTRNVDYKFNHKSPLDYSVTNPEHYSSSKVNALQADVTPPHSKSNSPRQSNATISQPSVFINKPLPGHHQYYFPDTCYAFNIGGNALKKSEVNMKRDNWREHCNYKIRHELNRELKEYSALSQRLKNETNPNNLRSNNLSLYKDSKLCSNIVKSQNYVNNISKNGENFQFSQEQLKSDAKLLINMRNRGDLDKKPKAKYPLKHSNSNIRLPSFNEILKTIPMDKSAILPHALSIDETNQFKNSPYKFSFDPNATHFNNGRSIKLNNPINEYSNLFQQQRIDNINSLYNQQLNTFQSYNMNNGGYYDHYNYSRAPIAPVMNNIQHSNAYNDFTRYVNINSNSVSPIPAIPNNERRDSKFNLKSNSNPIDLEIKPLIVAKNRRNSNKNKKKSSSRSSSKSSKSSSRLSSITSTSATNAGVSTNKITKTTIAHRPRTRSSSANSIRSVSNDSVRTAELPASVKNTPKTPSNNLQQSAEISALLTTEFSNSKMQTKPQTITFKTIESPMTSLNKTVVYNSNHNHKDISINESHNHQIKKCVSCHSSDSPCWRPSWSKEEGQLCNSCGLRYRKTKARCCNVKCLKIPSKSEWSLMEKRGKILACKYDNDGKVIGQATDYRCLDCDSVVEVL